MGVIAALLVLGVLAVLLVLRAGGFGIEDLTRVGTGDAERLAELRDGCVAGSMRACDDLFLESPVGSPEEELGDSCGGRNEPVGWCVDLYGETAP